MALSEKALNLLLWIAQILLAFAFAMAGYMKLSTPISELATQMQWVSDLPEWMVRFIGLCEFLGAMGLLIPALMKMKTILTPWAATGLAAVMLLAALFHFMRGEHSAIAVNAGFGVVAAFVAWGRFKKVRLTDKK